MGIEQANAALETDLNNNSGGESTDTNQQSNTQGTPATEQTPYVLDTAQKFMWKGKEMTPGQLEKGFMLHSDYTKKAQQVAEQRKFYDNVDADLEKVRANPALKSEFLKVYPKEFHKLLSYMGIKEEPQGGMPNGFDKAQLPPEMQQALNDIKSFKDYVQNNEIKAKEQELENISMRLTQKYPEAIEDVVLARAQVLIDDGVELTEAVWDKLYKASHEGMLKRDNERKTKTFDSQKQSNQQGRSIGKGGGTAGSAPKRMSMAEATEAAVRDYTKG